MKCWKCGEENVQNVSKCVYCGADLLRSVPRTEIGTALRQLYDHYGCKKILTNPLLMVNGLGDLVSDSHKFRNHLRIALDAGVGKLYLEQIQSSGTPDNSFEEKIRNILLEDAELSDAVVRKIMDAFDEMIGWKKTESSSISQNMPIRKEFSGTSSPKPKAKKTRLPFIVLTVLVLAACAFLIANQSQGWIPVPWATASLSPAPTEPSETEKSVTPTPAPEITDVPTSVPEKTPTPAPEITDAPTPVPEDTPTPAPEITDAPTPVPEDTPTPAPEITDAPTPVPEDTPTPAPEITDAPTPVPEPTEVPVPDISEMKNFKIGDVLLYGVQNGEKIKWIVIDTKDLGNGQQKITLITQNITAFKLFNNRYIKVTWPDSSLRAWLNKKYTSYFIYEKYQPEVVSVRTSVNSSKDQVWILSEKEYSRLPEEVKNLFEGAIANADTDLYDQDPTFEFWLRDSGKTESRAKYAAWNGEIYQKEVDQQLAVRPVISLIVPVN